MNQFKHQMNQFKHQHIAHQQNFPHKLQQRRVYHEATFATFKVYPHDTALLLPISINLPCASRFTIIASESGFAVRILINSTGAGKLVSLLQFCLVIFE